MWFIISIGFLPVLAVVAHCLGIIALKVCLLSIVLPAFCFVIVCGIKNPALGKIILRGWIAGCVAVACYDLSRIPFILNGWIDFIPKIGAWLKNAGEPDALVGYLWRYAGNGGGMGTAFFVLLGRFRPAKRIVLLGVAYGLGIFISLMFVLVLFKEAQAMMFEITVLTFTGSLIGHLIYGLVLGFLAAHFNKAKANSSILSY